MNKGKLLRGTLLALISSALLYSCAGGWTNEDKNDFLNTCKTSARSWAISPEQGATYCDCALGKTMEHYPTINEVVINADSTALNKDLKECKSLVGYQGH